MLFAATDDGDDLLSMQHQESGAEKYLIFLSNSVLYGVNADCVAEIITDTSVTSLPMLPRHIRGVFNLRGQIVPIIDFRMLLGVEPGEDYCTIVLDLEETKLGILVDKVDQMVDIDREMLHPVPYQNMQDTHKLICGMYSLPGGGGTMMVVDCALLINGQ